MYLLTRKNRVIDYCEEGYTYIGNTVVCKSKGTKYEDATIVYTDKSLPSDIDIISYDYINGEFIRHIDDPILLDDLYKVGDILHTRRSDLGANWVLCNGDIVPDLSTQYSLSKNPVYASRYVTRSSGSGSTIKLHPKKIVHDKYHDVYIEVRGDVNSYSTNPGDFIKLNWDNSIHSGTQPAQYFDDISVDNKGIWVYRRRNPDTGNIIYAYTADRGVLHGSKGSEYRDVFTITLPELDKDILVYGSTEYTIYPLSLSNMIYLEGYWYIAVRCHIPHGSAGDIISTYEYSCQIYRTSDITYGLSNRKSNPQWELFYHYNDNFQLSYDSFGVKNEFCLYPLNNNKILIVSLDASARCNIELGELDCSTGKYTTKFIDTGEEYERKGYSVEYKLCVSDGEYVLVRQLISTGVHEDYSAGSSTYYTFLTDIEVLVCSRGSTSDLQYRIPSGNEEDTPSIISNSTLYYDSFTDRWYKLDNTSDMVFESSTYNISENLAFIHPMSLENEYNNSNLIWSDPEIQHRSISGILSSGYHTPTISLDNAYAYMKVEE